MGLLIRYSQEKEEESGLLEWKRRRRIMTYEVDVVMLDSTAAIYELPQRCLNKYVCNVILRLCRT